MTLIVNRVENMTLLTKNIELQGTFRNSCQIIWGWAVKVTAQICQSTR